MEQDDEMKLRETVLQAMKGRTPTFILLSIIMSCLGWLLAYLTHSLAGGIFIQIIALAIPIERRVAMRCYTRYLVSHKQEGG